MVYVFVMTPCESFLHCNNGSSTFKQLALMAFLLLQYIFILSYHPSNLISLNMNEIQRSTQLKIRNLHNIENKLTRYNHHKDFLQNYKTNRKYPKGLSLKFDLVLVHLFNCGLYIYIYIYISATLM